MNCLEFRHQHLVDPYRSGEEAQAHLKSCPGCAEFYSDVRTFDEKLETALKISVPENLRPAIMLRQSLRNDRRHKTGFFYALAASLLIAITATFMFTWQPGHSLDREVFAYVESVQANELDNLQTAGHPDIDAVLRPLGMQLDSSFGPVQAARPCYIRGQAAAHLIMPGTEGAINIIYMPSEEVAERIQVSQQNNQLILFPCPKGSLAIIGSTREQLAIIEERLQSASTWL